jgi:hypothetical protein
MTDKTRRLLKGAAFALAASLVAAAPALAHHSFAMFDFTKTVTIKGTVSEFEWKNPHVILHVVGDTGPAEEWWMELTSPGNLARGGWTRTTYKAGDKVVVELSPLRTGAKGGAFKKGTQVATGQVMTSNLQQPKPGLD